MFNPFELSSMGKFFVSLCVVAHWLKNYSNKKLGGRKKEREKERQTDRQKERKKVNKIGYH